MTGVRARARRPVGGADPPDDGAGPAIRAAGLRKTYASRRGTVEAVRDVDLDIARGRFFGLLGPNGAGKSTTIGMLTTLVVPSGGTARVAGFDVAAHPVEVKRRIGVVSQSNTLDRALTVGENLEFRWRYFRPSQRAARQRASEVLELLHLSDRRRAMVHELSGGQARRLMIGRALMHRPHVLFLDEPTAGIDPQARVNLWETLRQLHADGLTILLTTHYLEEAEALCEEVAIIDRGRLLACDAPDRLRATAGADTVVTVAYDGAAPTAAGALGRRASVRKVEVDGDRIRVWADRADGALVSELVDAGAAAGRAVCDVTTVRPSLETVFLALTGREYRE